MRWPHGQPVPAELRDVEFVSGDGLRIRGWYIPGPTPATIIVLHGGMADRRQMVPEAMALSAGGLGVLLYDQPGAGTSDGRVTFGPTEHAALHAAIAWLHSLDPRQRIGLLGFSQGAFIAATAVRDEPAIAALVLTGVFADFAEQTRFTFRRWGLISQWAGLTARRWAGYVPTELAPLATIATFGKPLLIISGERDNDIPADDAQRLYDAAQSPKAHWTVAGAWHGNYMAVAPTEYAERLTSFFHEALGE